MLTSLIRLYELVEKDSEYRDAIYAKVLFQ